MGQLVGTTLTGRPIYEGDSTYRATLTNVALHAVFHQDDGSKFEYGTSGWIQTSIAGAGLVHTKASDITDSILETFDQVIYGPLTTGNGELITGLSDYTSWSFHIIGADATNNFAVNAGMTGTTADQDGLQLRDLSGGASVTTIVAAGVYVLAVPGQFAFKDLQVIRSGAGNASCTIRALGRVI